MRIATFNIENLDNKEDDRNPTLNQRAPILKELLTRIDADIVCLQEVHGQEQADHTPDNPKRDLSALDFVLKDTKYENYHRTHTITQSGVPFNERNLVILSSKPIIETKQYKNSFIQNLEYLKVTADPAEDDANPVKWERPILHSKIELSDNEVLHVINLHLKSRLASNINGQKENQYTWKSAAGWAEGYFLSSIKRVGQALETRILIDDILNNEPNAKIVVCGDFNAEPGEVPVEAIQGRTENTSNPDLISKVLIPCSRAIPESIRFSHLHHGKGNLLDHMLVSRGLYPFFSSATIFNETLHDESLPYAFDSKYPESDHAPFICDFSI